MERDRIAWLVRLRLIKANEIHDLAAILTALKRIGLTPSTSCSAVRTSARRNSSSAARSALASIVPDLPCLLVMVCILAKGSGDGDITRIP
jgi:hypothetical protein